MTMLPLAQARSFLFVPGNRPERFAKALASGSDAVIIDLEDAVPLDAKDEARAALAAAWPGFDEAQRARLLVRVNPAATPWHEAVPSVWTARWSTRPCSCWRAKFSRRLALEKSGVLNFGRRPFGGPCGGVCHGACAV